jgi:biotin-dependent carboxylase-like uncharacterized protein
MHLGIPPGGPLAPSRFRAANAAVGNPPDAPAIEVVGAFAFESDGGDLHVAVDDEAFVLAPGETRAVSSSNDRRVRYVAVRGGIDVPIAFGGRGTLIVASIGGYEGRALRKGDALAIGTLADTPRAEARGSGADTAIARIVPGPDEDAFVDGALDTLLSGAYRLSREADRVGVRLDGPPLAQKPRASTRRSAPMVRGAIEVAGTRPIVLGPDHPTTGGYPVIAVIVAADVENVVAAPIGKAIRFERCLG